MYTQSRGWQMLQLSKQGTTAGLQTIEDAPITVKLQATADKRDKEPAVVISQKE